MICSLPYEFPYGNKPQQNFKSDRGLKNSQLCYSMVLQLPFLLRQFVVHFFVYCPHSWCFRRYHGRDHHSRSTGSTSTVRSIGPSISTLRSTTFTVRDESSMLSIAASLWDPYTKRALTDEMRRLWKKQRRESPCGGSGDACYLQEAISIPNESYWPPPLSAFYCLSSIGWCPWSIFGVHPNLYVSEVSPNPF
jgi:hypothetical protein